MNHKPKSIFIGLCVILMAAAIYILDISYLEDQETAKLDVEKTTKIPSIPVESGVFQRSDQAMNYAEMPENENSRRTLEAYYANRAYYGAPPYIPHPLLSEKGIGGKTCLQCHENGGYVEQFKAYTPVTPHPEMLNCKQCHVPKSTAGLFKASEFDKISPPKVKNAALPGSPPVIPHGLQMRENCLACHAGPAAVKEIRVTHPERVNCRQCHALGDKIDGDFGVFEREVSESPSPQ